MAKVDPKDFLLNTDYELDKIILVKTGSFVKQTDIAHGLSFTPLIFGIWSTDSNFNSANIIGPQLDTEPIPGLYTPPLSVGCYALSDKIALNSNGDGADNTTIYYRVYAFANPDANANTPKTSHLAKSFMINTDYNYRKLKASGTFTAAGQSYEHNLGYRPQVMAWIQFSNIPGLAYSNGILPVTDASFFTNYFIEVTPTQIRVSNDFPFGFIAKVMWRVYYDEA